MTVSFKLDMRNLLVGNLRIVKAGMRRV
jgi:hypothetical protein